eukprot:maker-scaffold_21-snap-gene-4.42-mRNA-1 protein AED:0.17 eAED:0.17 QI:105/1/1/1/1/1/4/57/756
MDLSSTTAALTSINNRKNIPESDLKSAKILLALISDQNSKNLLDISHLSTLLNSSYWESVASGLVYLTECAKRKIFDKTNVKFSIDAIRNNLDHLEPRVRICGAKLLAELGRDKVLGSLAWEEISTTIFKLIKENMHLGVEERSKLLTNVYDDNIENIAHETVGWKALETSLRSLEYFISSFGEHFVNKGYLTEELISMILEECLQHENRFVREVGYDLCTEIVPWIFQGNQELIQTFSSAITKGLEDNWSQVRFAASRSARILVENFQLDTSEEKFVQSLEKWDPQLRLLVPRMCLNRYYLAQGVKLYSQNTWKLIFSENNCGIRVIQRYLDEVVKYYVSQCTANNHAVREASCHCLAELVSRVPMEIYSEDKVNNWLKNILDALVLCFKDQSWPVRDAACLATAKVCSVFIKIQIVQEIINETLEKLWVDHLSDNIWSVREDSAIALGEVCKAYVENSDNLKSISKEEEYKVVFPLLPEFVQKVFLRIPQMLKEYEKEAEWKENKLDLVDNGQLRGTVPAVDVIDFDAIQKSTTSKYSTRSSIPTGVVTGKISELKNLENNFNAAKEAHFHDSLEQKEIVEKFSSKQVFSCGSLAPKLKRANRGVGCMDHGFAREKQHWEVSDGALYLIRELCVLDTILGGSFSKEFLPLVAVVAKDARRFKLYPKLQQTLWKIFISSAEKMGNKRRFKRYLELFLPQMIKDLEHSDRLLSNEARNCFLRLERFVGVKILQHRINDLFEGDTLNAIVQRSLRKL